jgi:hypothetical protein
MPSALKLARIVAKAKEVHFVEPFGDTVGLTRRPDLQEGLWRIQAAIEAGSALPSFAYRRSTRPDRLLEREGMMHLHLAEGSRELLYLIQYDAYVVFLEVSDHGHFDNEPPGAVLKAKYRTKVGDVSAAKDAVRERKRQDIRARLLPRPPK